jgi:hypothetical protein
MLLPFSMVLDPFMQSQALLFGYDAYILSSLHFVGPKKIEPGLAQACWFLAHT